MKKILFIVLITLSGVSAIAQSAQDIAKAMSGGKKVKPKPEYNFAGSLKFQFSAVHDGQSSKGQQTWYFPSGS